MKLSPRRIKKRHLILLILLCDLLLALFMIHTNRMTRVDKVDMGRLKWLGTNALVMSGLELFRDVCFSRAIEKGEVASTEVEGQGKAVDSILSRVNTGVREILSIDTKRLRGLENSVFPRFEAERKNCKLGIQYVEELAKDFLRRVDRGGIRYPVGNKNARKYVMKMKSFVQWHSKGKDRSDIIKIVNRMFPTIEVSFYTYMMIVLLNIREMIVRDFDAIEEFLKREAVCSVSNEKISQFDELILKSEAFEKEVHDWSTCVLCNEEMVEERRMDLLRLKCNDIVCKGCLKRHFLYEGGESCRACGRGYNVSGLNPADEMLG